MLICNRTKNTIFVDDINLHLLYKEGESEEISPDTLKKSKDLQNLIINSTEIDIEKYNDKELIELSIVHRKENCLKNVKQTEPETYATDSSSNIEVKMHGLFYDASGYGKVNRNLALGLHELGAKIKISPKRSQNQLNAKELEPLVKLEKTEISRNHILIDSVIPSFSELSTGKYKILYTTIESYSVPKQFVECCFAYDEIWVTSPFAKEILQKEIKNKLINVIPAGVDENLYTENGPSFEFNPSLNSFVFVSVFAWGYRKGYDVLLKAYFDEFNADDDVSLLIMSRYQSGQSKHHKEKIKNDIDAIMKKYDKPLPHVVRYGQMLPEEKMPMFYRAGNCFILCTRGESSNLCAPEASLCGSPVIMTNVSGQKMYLKPDNAFLIEPDVIESIPKGLFEIHYWDEQKFPRLTSPGVNQQVKEQMRFVFENRELAKERNKNLQQLIKEKYTWKLSCQTAMQRLEEIKRTRF